MIFSLTFVSCKEDELMGYQLDDNIFFSWARTTFADSLDISFIYDITPKADSTVQVPVSVMGNVVDHNREFKFVVDKETTTAQEGTEYKLKSETCVIPAGQETGYIEVILYNTDDLAKKSVQIGLRLEPNSNFKTNYTYIESGSSSQKNELMETMDPLYCRVISSAVINKPKAWVDYNDLYTNNFGAYSNAKLLVLCEVLNLNLRDWVTPFETSYLAVYKLIFQRYLEDRKNNNDPVLEDDGSEMTAGA